MSASGTIYVHLVDRRARLRHRRPRPSTTLRSIEPQYAGDSVCLYTLDPGTGVATLVGTTGLFQTPFFGLALVRRPPHHRRHDDDERRVGHREHLHR